ncbi:MAG: glycosyltransferase family 2 protein [Rhodospirillaceae bacterium]|nr:MAG: glycosyltransferase family 2 protein [Rhodospirillaceae bacterium]
MSEIPTLLPNIASGAPHGHNETKGTFELTILMPCLNEAATIGTCVQKALGFLRHSGVSGEVLIADNGSTDNSQQIASQLGARIVAVAERGYGAALIGGINAARGRFIIMGDADDSYDFSSLQGFVDQLRAGSQLVMGNRFGGISVGAMPFLHRYLGNPVLSYIGRLFFKVPVGDFHCGLRGFDATSIRALDLKTTGMEFATEMVVRSALAGLKIGEVPTTLKPDGRNRPPHLRTWRDGWRHLKFLLMYCPRWLYMIPGFICLMLGGLGGLLLLFGPIDVGNVVLDLNTLLVACFLVMLGTQLLTFGALSRYYATITGFLPHTPRTQSLVKWASTDRLLLISLLVFAVGFLGFGYAVRSWAHVHFGPLHDPFVPRLLIVGITTMIIALQTAFAAFMFGIFEIPLHDRR